VQKEIEELQETEDLEEPMVWMVRKENEDSPVHSEMQEIPD
jgi:hypothetical protein